MTPAMLKAAIVGNALSVKGGVDRYTGGTIAARPNAVQGFGRLYLGDALATSGVTQTYLDESTWTPFTAAGQWRSRAFTIANTSKPTVIVLAWTDEPAGINANPTLVRDLDAEILFSDGCRGYTGNQMLSTEVSRTQGVLDCGIFTYDALNNTEMIVIPAGAMSSFTLDIYMTTWGFGTGDQRFAVFAANAY